MKDVQDCHRLNGIIMKIHIIFPVLNMCSKYATPQQRVFRFIIANFLGNSLGWNRKYLAHSCRQLPVFGLKRKIRSGLRWRLYFATIANKVQMFCKIDYFYCFDSGISIILVLFLWYINTVWIVFCASTYLG